MTTIHPSSAQSTPGLEVPGAYPRELYPDHPTPTTRQRPSDLPQSISLPSTEKEGTHPGEHCGGVGPLPGSISETSVAKLPDERASERKAASAPVASSRLKEVTTDTDRGDDDPIAAVAAGEGEASSGSKEPHREHDVGEGVAKVPDEGSKSASESASGLKGLAVDTELGDDAREGTSSGAPQPHDQDISPVLRTDVQGPPEAVGVGEQVPTELRAETSETADVSPADSKFKEELRREEKSRGVFDKGPSSPPPSSRAATPEDLAPAQQKGGDEDPNKTSEVQQQQQQQPEIAGGHGPRKGRSSSDSEPSNYAKASIMNRVKGEMKVLLGKASGNREKVEEGERMKQGAQ